MATPAEPALSGKILTRTHATHAHAQTHNSNAHTHARARAAQTRLEARARKHARQISIAEKFEHPGYGSGITGLENDITLLHLSKVRPLHRCVPSPSTRPTLHSANDEVSRACLLLQPVDCVDSIPMPSLDDGSYSDANMTATVAGWGATSEGGSLSDVLHSVDLKLLTNAQCDAYGYSGRLADSMICAIGDLEGGEDSCQGDSGGPLFVQQAPSAPPAVTLRGSSHPLHPHPKQRCRHTPHSNSFFGRAGGAGHNRRRCLVGLRLREKGYRRSIHARLLVPRLDTEDERCGCYQVPARVAVPAFVAAHAARAASNTADALAATALTTTALAAATAISAALAAALATSAASTTIFAVCEL